LDEEARDHIEAQARLLYGLVHARYIITTRGLGKMVRKFSEEREANVKANCNSLFLHDSWTSISELTLGGVRVCYAINNLSFR
jgi:hypothetical protein